MYIFQYISDIRISYSNFIKEIDYFEGEKKEENSIYLPSTNTRATKTRILGAQLRE